MRIVIQRVNSARVVIDGIPVATIRRGLVVLAGIAKGDTEIDADYLARKMTQLRIFEDSSGKMNRSVAEAGGEILLIPNFTLYGDCRKGRRPDFDLAAAPEAARAPYAYLMKAVEIELGSVETGVFQAHMEVELVNDGPVTLICDSRERT